jgi:glucose/arabinose dehydrogenase
MQSSPQTAHPKNNKNDFARIAESHKEDDGMVQRSPGASFLRLPSFFSKLLIATLLIACASAGMAQTSLPPEFNAQVYASGMYRPVDLHWAPNDTLFVTTKKGIVWVIKDGVRLPTPFMDIQDEVNGTTDRGMLGFTTHPDFPNTPWIYVQYTYDPPEAAAGSGTTGRDGKGERVSRMIRVTADASNNYDTMLPGSEVVLVGGASTWANIGDPSAEQTDLSADWACGNDGAYIEDCIPGDGISHTVGTLKFGPDGMLYASIGDAASYSTVDLRAIRSIRLDSLAGKVLRIDPVTGEGLPDNPFWDGNPDSNRSKVWNLGLRNPYRFNFAPGTNNLWIGEVGWGDWEEINFGVKGSDFGWPCYEGEDGVLLQQPGYAPLAECQEYYLNNNAEAARYSWEHVPVYGGAAIAGEVYTGIEWPAEYQDALFFTDYATEEVFYARTNGGNFTVYPFAEGLLVVDMVFGPDGALYTVDVVEGEVTRITYQGDPIGTIVAGFADDFTPVAPPPGWAYEWNASSALGNSAGYAPLLWDGDSLYDSDGLAGRPDATAMSWGNISAGSMHPGRGVGNGETDNRHAIAQYTITESGYYSIYNSTASHTGCASSDGVQVSVLVNNSLFESRLINQGESKGFDENLGYLVAGSTISVAVGPNSKDGCDKTDIDWSILYQEGAAPVGNPPVVTISSPNQSVEWIIDDVVNFAGSATDPEDGILSGNALRWEVSIHHNEHEHPDYFTAIGETGSFQFPDHDDNSYLEICLIATDSDGRVGKACVDARPDEVLYTFNSSPVGLDLTYNGRMQPTPFSVPVPIGGVRQISAPVTQGTYTFNYWSIGGPETQQIIVSATDITLEAYYQDLGGVPQAFETSISDRYDDAEEELISGVVLNASSDLEMTLDDEQQLIGLRFNAIPVDAGAMITNAWVQFTADEADSAATSLLIQGEAGNSITGFRSSSPVSNRARTSAAVSWEPAAWNIIGETGPDQRTPNIAAIVTEIINSPGWASGDSLSLIISGTGKRVADSFDSASGIANSARLHIDYLYPVANLAPTVTITDPADGLETNTATTVNLIATATDPEDGNIAANLEWTSSLDGLLGNGASIATTLTQGSHTITASATDSGGETDSNAITVTVIQAPIFSGQVAIDIIPGDTANFVDANISSPVPVAVLTTSVADGDAADFDSQQVDGLTVQFGPLGAVPLDSTGTSEDVDLDGDIDRTFIFDSQQTGILCEDTEAELTGATFSGAPIHGTDFVTPTACPTCHP